uniref:PD-(D/E)XK nuclease domain-containing protein n=1 Tax=Sulfurihydrogenibium sp. TaxID=2053621 RepID=UPI00263195CD
IDYIYPENLLFQSGYLTIKQTIQIEDETIYILSYPNHEVRKSFNRAFLTHIIPPPQASKTQLNLIRAFLSSDIEKIKQTLYSFFASIPTDWYRKNNIQEYEGFYASVVYALFIGSGLTTIAEDTTNKGKIDLTVIAQEKVYIIEFKVIEETQEGKALQQIKEKKYYAKYQDKYEEIYLIGIEFSKEKRNITNFEVEKMY